MISGLAFQADARRRLSGSGIIFEIHKLDIAGARGGSVSCRLLKHERERRRRGVTVLIRRFRRRRFGLDWRSALGHFANEERRVRSIAGRFHARPFQVGNMMARFAGDVVDIAGTTRDFESAALAAQGQPHIVGGNGLTKPHDNSPYPRELGI
jgi:hypothetical protein